MTVENMSYNKSKAVFTVKAKVVVLLQNESTINELHEVIAKLEKKRDEESGSVMEKLTNTLSEVKKQEALAESARDNMKGELKSENKRKKELTKNSTDVSLLHAPCSVAFVHAVLETFTRLQGKVVF